MSAFAYPARTYKSRANGVSWIQRMCRQQEVFHWVAPVTSSHSLPSLEIAPSLALPPVECCLATRPIQAARLCSDENTPSTRRLGGAIRRQADNRLQAVLHRPVECTARSGHALLRKHPWLT